MEEDDIDQDTMGDADAAPKMKKKVLKGPAENKSKKEHINVVFIGHVGRFSIISCTQKQLSHIYLMF